MTSTIFQCDERFTDGQVISIIPERKIRSLVDIGTRNGALTSNSVDRTFIHVLMSISSWFSF